MTNHNYQKKSLSISLKEKIFPIPKKIIQDYPLHLPFIRFFLKEELNDSEKWMLYEPYEMDLFWSKLRGHNLDNLLSPFSKNFYNGRIETLFKESFPEKSLEDRENQQECLQFCSQNEEILLAASRDLAHCLLYEWVLQLRSE